MKTPALLCNLALFALMGGIVATEGIPERPAYAAFTVVMLWAPAFTAFVIMRRLPDRGRPGPAANTGTSAAPSPGGGPDSRGMVMPRIAASTNLVLSGFVCWALVSQYPYPEGRSVIPYAVVALLTPLLSLAVLVRAARPAALGRRT
jgi:hypothetical protein